MDVAIADMKVTLLDHLIGNNREEGLLQLEKDWITRLGPLGRQEISCLVNKEGIGVQAINQKLPFDSPEFGFIFSQSHHFHFSTHIGKEHIFASFPL